MKVDNFELISDTFLFKEDLRQDIANDWFYMVTIMTRTKDTGEKPKHIRTLFVESREYLKSHKDMIVKMCEMFNARAYISVNHSSYRTCAMKMLKELADIIEGGGNGYKSILSLPETVAGTYTCGAPDKRWIVDLDGIRTDEELKPYIDFIINEYNEGRGSENGEVLCVPTVNGTHLLVSPFDVRGFKKRWPEVEIHHNNPTILYYGGNGDGAE